MKNKTTLRFAQSLLFLPLATVSVPFQGIPKAMLPDLSVSQTVSVQNEYLEANATLAFNEAIVQRQEVTDLEVDAIDSYFKKHSMPLAGTGALFVAAADKYHLDWRLLPAIAVRESTGGKFACTSVAHSFFGWGSCKISFKSDAEAIESLARNLSGQNKNTAHHYSGKTTKEILQKYNPPSVVPDYADQVMRIMAQFGTKDITLIPNASIS